MKITLDALIVLDAIDRKGSFAGAAEELFRVPSAITYTVQKLEQDLDVALFDRSGHRARLTAAGQKLLEDGRHLLRSASELECGVKRIATGWESQLSITVGDILPIPTVFPLVEQFYREEHGTVVRLRREVLSGVWESLISHRADIAIGASTEVRPEGFSTKLLGTVQFTFVVSPQHPLAASGSVLTEKELQRHRVVTVADTARDLSPVTTSVLSGQEVLSVPDMNCKIEAQKKGLGIGYVPRYMIRGEIERGELIEKPVVTPVSKPQIYLAWRNRDMAKAMEWFLDRLSDPKLYAGIIDPE